MQGQPNKLVWPQRLKETPPLDGEKPYAYYRRLSEKYDVSFKTAQDKYLTYSKNGAIKQELAEAINTPLDELGIDKENVNGAWYKSKEWSIFFNPNKGNNDFIDILTSALSNYKFTIPIFEPIQSDKCGLINIYDAHIDKLCILDSNGERASVEDNINTFKQAFITLFHELLIKGVTKIIFPLGNDYYQTNDRYGNTVKGTKVDVYPDWQKSYITGVEAEIWCIDYALHHKVEVHCPIIYSNHDADKLFFMGYTLALYYAGNDNVKIDYSDLQRKYIAFGKTLLGFAHGDKEKPEKLPSIMSFEAKQDWANSTHTYWFLGDKHHKKEFNFMRVKDHIACEVRFLRSASGTDKWHFQEGYIGIPKSAQAHIIDYNNGIIATFEHHF